MRIESFTCWTVEVDRTPAFIWRNGLPVSNSDTPPGSRPRSAVIRMDTDEGVFGAVMKPNGDAIFDLVRRRYNHFIGEDPLLTEKLWNQVWEVDRLEEIGVRELGILDVLCWDVKSKKAQMPIYQMLGGYNRKVPAYASTVTWPTLGEYERYIKQCKDLGFKAFKLHAWGDVARDKEWSVKLREWVGPDADFRITNQQ